MTDILDSFRTVWTVDFEFCRHPTLQPDVVCLAARELHSGTKLALWRDEIGPVPPYDIGDDAIVVFYSGQEAELACHLALGWRLPENCIDLIAEYRMAINGLEYAKPAMSLLEACAACGVTTYISQGDKDRVRQRIIAGWPFSDAERAEILGMCQYDVQEEEALLLKLPPVARTHFALHYGDYIKAIARAWFRGVPLDPRFTALTGHRTTRQHLQEKIIEGLEDRFPVWDGVTLKNQKLGQVFADYGYPLPAAGPSGRVVSEQDKLRRIIGDSGPLVELVDGMHTLGQLREFDLPIGSDNRLRAWFAPFWTATSRAAPATNEYIFNLPAWLRGAMAPPTGYALVYTDWSAMEFGIAGARSGDTAMTAFYHQPCWAPSARSDPRDTRARARVVQTRHLVDTVQSRGSNLGTAD
jgi:hypothetical protein